jgi:PAS domain S-box-containing protein
MSRLGLLIVLQVVFLFVAISMVLFVQEPSMQNEPTDQAVRASLSKIEEAARWADGLSAPDPVRQEELFAKALQGGKVYCSAALYALHDNRAQCLYSYWASDADRSVDAKPSSPDSVRTEALVQFVTGQPDGFVMTTMNSDLSRVHYYHVILPHTGSAVLAVGEMADVIVSPRTQLKSVLLSLFLVSTLLSLLIVYLLWTRFKEPLERLTREMEKTASGGQYVTMAPQPESEMSRLTEGFNKMSESLRHDHDELLEAHARLQQANHALSDSENFLMTVIDSSPSGLMVTDPNGRVVLFNRAACREFRCTVEEAIGSSVAQFFTLPPSYADANDKAWGFETVCWRRDGDVFPAYILTCEIFGTDASPRGQLYILRDIVESRSFQDMMVRLDRMATRGAMAGDIGHEINNFLAVLLGNVELLPRSIAKNDEPAIKKKLDIMKTNVEKIARFADGLMESPQEESVFSPVNINQIVENVVAFVRFQNRFDGIDWVIQLHPDLKQAEMDDSQIQQVLVNLLYNAAEAVGDIEGNHVLTISSSIVDNDGQSLVRVDIKDNGPGVQKDKEPLLFRTRFTTKKRGHGIGLITCQRIIDHHAGKIGYAFANGAHFWFELPVVHPSTKGQAFPESAAASV